MITVKTYKVSMHTERYYELECDKVLMRTYKGTTIRVDIRKDVLIEDYRGRLRAKTFAYSYSANLPNPDGRNLIRYCSPHEDHNKFHHKHDYTTNPTTVSKIGSDEYPHVNEFLHEVLESF